MLGRALHRMSTGIGRTSPKASPKLTSYAALPSVMGIASTTRVAVRSSASNMMRTPAVLSSVVPITSSWESTSSSSRSSRRFLLPALLLAAATVLGADVQDGESNTKLASFFQSIAHACGIVGVVGDGDVNNLLMEGLQVMKNRGYDSAGVATVADDELLVTKYASRETTADSIDLLMREISKGKHAGHSVGIAHTRWATHGGKTDANAHPHADYKNRIALVHNGTINNSHELRKELKERFGIHFSSETDTEVIAHLVGLAMDGLLSPASSSSSSAPINAATAPTNGHDMTISLRDAVAQALSRCEGTWGLAVVSKIHPDHIVVACNGSPMTIGLSQDKTFVASETAAFSRYTKQFIAMKDGEIGVVRKDGLGHVDMNGVSTGSGGALDISRIQTAPDLDILLSPHPYPHFTIRECLEQPEAISRTLAYGGRMYGGKVVLGGLDREKEKMEKIKNLVLTGCGTSLHAAMFGAKLMRDLDAFATVQAMDAGEVRRSDLPKQAGGLLAVSQSGETKDVHRAVRVAEETGMPCLSVVNSVGSLIARTTGVGVYLYAGREHAVASTKAFSTQATALALLAVWFRQLREETEGLPELQAKKELLDACARLPISFGMAMSTRQKCQKVAHELKNKRSLFVLGKGLAEPIAHEGALKIKEMSYIHAEGYSGGALKHGPFALIESELSAPNNEGPTPVILLILDDDHADRMRTAGEEIRARGGVVYVITDNAKLAKNIDDDPIVIPNNGPLTALIGVLPLQLIAYELAILRGVNPDVPRNLAKACTTD